MDAVERYKQIEREHKYLEFIHQIMKQEGINYEPEEGEDCTWFADLTPIVYGENGSYYCRAYTSVDLEPNGLLFEDEQCKVFSVSCDVEDVFKGVYVANVITGEHINLLIDFDNEDSYDEFTYGQINKIIRYVSEKEQIDLDNVKALAKEQKSLSDA